VGKEIALSGRYTSGEEGNRLSEATLAGLP